MTHRDVITPLAKIDYNGSPAGYVQQPGEVVNYVENHDNETLFDINVYKLPVDTSKEDRARVQLLGLATTMLSQGVAYFHAGVDLLRSKSLDRNSFNSGDWFNRLDFSYQHNNFGVGLPPAEDNEKNWALMKPLLGNALIKPEAAQIDWTRRAFLDLLKIRASTSLLRLHTATDIKQRLKFYNLGSTQESTVIIGHVKGEGYAGANFRELVYAINVDQKAHELVVPQLAGKALVLHPVHLTDSAVDQRAGLSHFNAANGKLHVPARTAVVLVAQ